MGHLSDVKTLTLYGTRMQDHLSKATTEYEKGGINVYGLASALTVLACTDQSGFCNDVENLCTDMERHQPFHKTSYEAIVELQ